MKANITSGRQVYEDALIKVTNVTWYYNRRKEIYGFILFYKSDLITHDIFLFKLEEVGLEKLHWTGFILS